ncbi:MAPEG family protein [Sphingomonas sp.]|uniref:MAPEG family protein n=1 Tax=Sphingomonas sp. TaxID=28214 RepID=UPI00286A4C50|nr:MAPEG family protein [Sphingomonas sp.]
MVFWITIVLALIAVQILLPLILDSKGTMGARLTNAMGPRDHCPEESVVAQRSRRGLANLLETLPIFLTLALLAIILHKDVANAILGAQIYVIARVIYVPAYLSGVPVVRTLIWGASAVGLVIMARAILG